MRNTKVLKVIVMLFAIVLTIAMLMPTVFAASNLQSNPTTGSAPQVKTGQEWAVAIRAMEQSYYGAGEQLEEINDDLTPTTSNNIDVHFMKTSEYGAIAILSASEYGKGNKVITTTKGDNSGTTTGNKTGVIIDTKIWEATASSSSGTFYLEGYNRSGTMKKPAASRYYDPYSTETQTERTGDALLECRNWHGSNTFGWPTWADCCIKRGYNGIFNYTHYSYYNYNNDSCDSGDYSAARGVAVCGEGF